ncbi:hypothetical protein IFM89_029969 [Coptis chinensis]|uniref:Uncharacterized protein n=1 Tax=Coptis chinensis TaxID=261450 RepID=A0A835M1T4_9MAGN|nr:hypothetical protein IFM89_029969 [Coptis chinensis]
MEESVRYCMEYMPKGRKGSHKRGKFMDDEADLDGRPNHNHGTKVTTNKKGKSNKHSELVREPPCQCQNVIAGNPGWKWFPTWSAAVPNGRGLIPSGIVTTGHSLSRQPIVSHSGQTCELQSMGGRVVAIGRMLGDRVEVPENAYRIVVDEILEFHAELFGARGKTFGDIIVGSTVTWPKAFTNVI